MSGRGRISIAYDSEGIEDYETGWGFAAVVSTGQHTVLFDCGWDGPILLRNLARFKLSVADLDAVAVSHSHWDHLSGLATVLEGHPSPEQLRVFVPASFSKNLKAEIAERADLVEVSSEREVVPGIWSTGELGNGVKEHSLLIIEGEGCTVITGCAHPGVGKILKRAEGICRPRCLVGGLHGTEPDEIPGDLECVIMCHCTAHRAGISRAFGGRASTGRAGMTIPLGTLQV